MIRELLNHASVGFPLAAFAFFFTTFIAVLITVARRSPEKYRDVASLPLGRDGDAS